MYRGFFRPLLFITVSTCSKHRMPKAYYLLFRKPKAYLYNRPFFVVTMDIATILCDSWYDSVVTAAEKMERPDWDSQPPA